MADTYTIAAAARLCGVARRTLQRAIQAGRLTLTVDHQVTLDALRQAGYAPAPTPQRQTAATPHGHRSDAPQALAPLLLPMVERLDRIIALLERLEAVSMSQGRTAGTPQRSTAGTPQGRTAAARRRDTAATPPPARGTPAVDAAYHRMQQLQAEGLTLAQIGARLTQEGYRTMRGRPWHKSTVSYILRTHGR
jgi:recombinase